MNFMRKTAVTLSAVGFALLSVSAVGNHVPDVPGATVSRERVRLRRVLIIGIDGCRTDALLKANTPHIDGLIRTGVFAPNTDIVGPRNTGAETVSGPGWASIFTGVYADKHGILKNSFFGSRVSQYPHFFHRLLEKQPTARLLSLSSWGPIHDDLVQSSNLSIDYSDAGPFSVADAKVTATAVRVLRERDPDVLCVYFGNVDQTGHNCGFHPRVKPYIDAIEQVDRHVGRLVAAVQQRRRTRHEDWLIVVCTDHGGRGMGHHGGHHFPEVRNVFLIFNSPSLAPRRIETVTHLVDVAPTVMRHLGFAVPADWEWDGVAVQERIQPATKPAATRYIHPSTRR
jgi:predicted AlkP superfamily pyrophosphatase or phosphodiesterase